MNANLSTPRSFHGVTAASCYSTLGVNPLITKRHRFRFFLIIDIYYDWLVILIIDIYYDWLIILIIYIYYDWLIILIIDIYYD